MDRRKFLTEGALATAGSSLLIRNTGAAPAAATSKPQTQGHTMQTLDHWPFKTYNRGRWKNDLGTLNLMSTTTVRRAFATVSSYENISIGSPLVSDGANPAAGQIIYQHEMTSYGRYAYAGPNEQLQSGADRITIDVHGMVNTHIDAFSHVGHDGVSFNNVPFADITTKDGAARFTIMDMPTIVTRAWLIDVPRNRGISSLEPGSPVLKSDLAPFTGKVEPGDAVVVRTGRRVVKPVSADDPHARDNHGNWSGMHVDCMDLIAEWDVGILATDGPGDNFPSTTPHCSVPIHIISEAYLGMPLVHSLDVEVLAEKLANRPSKAFMLSIAPLKIRGGTGSPVNPTAFI
jgi:kynurenine formamidase